MTDVVNGTNGMPAVVSFGPGNGSGYGGWDNGRTEQNQANMSIMQSIGALDKDVVAGQFALTTSVTSQLNSITGALAARVDTVKEVVNSAAMIAAQQLAGVDKDIMESRYLTLQNIVVDGDRTRSLIQAQYTDTLNRQLQTAQFDSRFENLYGLLNDANQSIKATNNAVNFGAGTVTASPAITSTNNRA